MRSRLQSRGLVGSALLASAASFVLSSGLPVPQALAAPCPAASEIVAYDANLVARSFPTLQSAITAGQPGWEIVVGSGAYKTGVVTISRKTDLTIRGCALPQVPGFKLQRSSGITLAGFDVNAAGTGNHGITLLGGENRNRQVVINGNLIHGAGPRQAGIFVARGNAQIAISGNTISRNDRDGIVFAETAGGPHALRNNTIVANGWNGVEVARRHTVVLEANVITGNGTAGGSTGGRYGVLRERDNSGAGDPAGIKLVDNTITCNNGREVARQSTKELGNYDQALDAADSRNTLFAFCGVQDAQPPTITVVAPVNGLETNQVVEPVYRVTDNDDPNPLVTITPTPPYRTDGVYRMVITATDRSGNQARTARDFTIDATPPRISVTAPVDEASVAVPTVEVLGTVDDPSALVTVNGAAAILAGTGFSARLNGLAVGRNTISVEARDPLGNRSTSVLRVNYTPPAPTATLSASPGWIRTGTASTLQWTTTDATTVSIAPEPGVVAASGLSAVSPAATTTYTLTARGPGGAVTATALVIVTQGGERASISAQPQTIPLGGSATISWAASGAQSVSISPGIGRVEASGSAAVSPAATTTYTIVAVGPEGAASSSVVVKVLGNVAALPEGSFGERYQHIVPEDATIPAYDAERFAVVTGSILDAAGAPLAGVTVSILAHPEYGTTTTNEAGSYALPVHGGGAVTVACAKRGYIPAQRRGDVGWKEVAVMERVVMIAEDPAATAVSFDGNPATVLTHRSTDVVDGRGSRAVTLVFSGDNGARVVSDGENSEPLPSIVVRATEYPTPLSMPAALPPASGFTFCAELAVDGAEQVVFEKPVVVYVENFLGFDVGMAVPVGSYDRQRGLWVPEASGQVVRLLDADGDGIVDAIDADDDGSADDLDGDGDTGDEARGLRDTARYAPGATFWRTAISHFSPWDMNWAIGLPRYPRPEVVPQPYPDQSSPGEVDVCPVQIGSSVDQRQRTYHEEVALAGTGVGLHYASNAVPGYQSRIVVPATGQSVPASLKRVDVELTVAGRRFEASLQAASNLKAEFLWNGLDFLGRAVSGGIGASARVRYVYDGRYFAAGDARWPFGLPGSSITDVVSRSELTVERVSALTVYRPGFRGDIAPGWTFTPHHRVDPADPRLMYRGDGGLLENNTHVVATVPNGRYSQENWEGGGGALAIDSAGSVFVTDAWTAFRRVLKIDRRGVVTTVAGLADGAWWERCAGSSGDGGPATEACLGRPGDIALGPGGELYVAESSEGRVRKIDRYGIISTIAGGGESVDDGGPATGAALSRPVSVAADTHGNVFIADSGSGLIRRVDSRGSISTVAGGGDPEVTVEDGSPAGQAFLDGPIDVVAAPDGALYVAQALGRIWKIAVDGTIALVAGRGGAVPSGEGEPALDVRFGDIASLALDRYGDLYVADASYGKVWKITPAGLVTRFAGAGSLSARSGEGIPALDAAIWPQGLAVGPSGDVFIETGMVIRKISVPEARLGSDAASGFLVTEQGAGHLFTSAGRHEKTIDLDTGVTLVNFGYDAAGDLASIVDRFDNRLTIQRDGEGRPYAVTAPDGQITELSIDADGRLGRVVYPDGSDFRFAYDAGGLMTDEYDPNDKRFRHQFDNSGRVNEIFDPEGGHWSCSRTDDAAGNATSAILSGEGDVVTHVSGRDLAGNRFLTTIAPDGAASTSRQPADGGTLEQDLACGTRRSVTFDYDTRQGYLFERRVASSVSSGLTRTIENTRDYLDQDGDEATDLIVETQASNGRSWRSENDLLAGMITATTPAGRAATLLYDTGSLLTLQTAVPGLLPTAYTYDSRGRMTGATTGERTVQYFYDAAGNLNRSVAADGRTFEYTHDLMGRLRSEVRPDGSTVGYQRDPYGNVTALLNPNQVSYGFGYTANNQRSLRAQPLSGDYRYLYDRDRRLRQVVLPSGRTIGRGYSGGRLSSTTTAEGVTSYEYLCSGRLGGATRSGEALAYEYDGPLITSDARTGTMNQTVGYTYNNDFAPIEVTYAGSTAVIEYDADGLPISVGDFAISRDAGNGLPISVAGLGLIRDRTFSGYGELDGESWTIGGAGVYDWTLARDAAGRIVRRTEHIGGDAIVWEYGSDAMGRLTRVSKNGAVVEEYSYDLNGNRLTEINGRLGGGGRVYGYSLEDHVLTAGSDSYQFDVDGFLESSESGAATTSYRYSTRGELQAAWLPGGGILTYVHDPMGRRIAKLVNGTTVEKYLWADRTRLLAVYDGDDNLLQRFAYADARLPVSMSAGGATYFLLADQVGSLRAVADAGGTTVKRIDYDSFGNILSDSNPAFIVPFGFAGGLHDRDTGLVRFGFRDYDPNIGRFTAKDPIDFAGGDTNLYAYTLNDPVNFVDPSGLYDYGPHLYVPIQAAAEAGMPTEIARRLGLTSESVDFTHDPTEYKNRGYHFSTTEQARARVKSACTISELGEAIHTLMDSFSHEGLGFFTSGQVHVWQSLLLDAWDPNSERDKLMYSTVRAAIRSWMTAHSGYSR